MKLRDATIAWTPSDHPNPDGTMPASPEEWAGRVAVGPRPPRGFVDDFVRWTYAGSKADASDDEHLRMLFINFHTMIVRDGIDPQAAHRALLVIDEYAETISPDISGARDAA